MKASDLFVRCLENEGVRYIFGVPGEENADLMISLLDSPIEFIVCRHEQAAAFMADVWGRLTGLPGVCLGTLGPGATNLLTGVADANMDRAPLVVVTGQAALKRVHKESHQAMDVVRMFRPVVKWNTSVSNPDTIPEVVRKAFKVAQLEKKGATHVELPEDIAKLRSLRRPLSAEWPHRPEPSAAAVEEAAALIAAAERPAVLAGNGVIRDDADGALLALVERTGMPVVNTFMGKGAIPASHRCSVFTVGLQARDHVVRVLEEADVVVCAGYDVVEYPPGAWNRGRSKKIIHIDFTPAEVDDAYQPAVEVLGGIRPALEALAQRVVRSDLLQRVGQPPASRGRDHLASLGGAQAVTTNEAQSGAWFGEFREAMQREFAEFADDTAFPPKPQKILWEVRRALGPEDMLLSDVGAHKMWIARYYQCERPNTCIISNGFASMGIALPGAIAAKLCMPERRVLAVCGDGGFLMNVHDLETAVRLKLPVVIMIWSDNGYGLIEWKQQVQYGRKSHTAFTNPDFLRLADSFGAVGLRVRKTEELPAILEQAFAADRAVLIDCPVDYRENLRLSQRLGEIPAPQRAALLKQVPIFAGVGMEHLDVFAGYMQERAYPAGAVLCRQGEPGDEVFLITRGEAEIEIARDDRAPERHKCGRGACIGEMAVLGDQPRAATVIAGPDGLDVLVLSQSDFREILLNQPLIAVQLLRVLSNRLAS